MSPSEKAYKDLIEVSIHQLRTVTETIARIRSEMNELTSMLPEYDTIIAMCGVRKTLGPQLIAEIGDVSRFTHRETITAFAGVDPGMDGSGKHISKATAPPNAVPSV